MVELAHSGRGVSVLFRRDKLAHGSSSPEREFAKVWMRRVYGEPDCPGFPAQLEESVLASTARRGTARLDRAGGARVSVDRIMIAIRRPYTAISEAPNKPPYSLT